MAPMQACRIQSKVVCSIPIYHNLDDLNMPRFFNNLKNFTEVATLAASGEFFVKALMLYTSKSLYNLQEYFRLPPKFVNIMKNVCKIAIS